MIHQFFVCLPSQPLLLFINVSACKGLPVCHIKPKKTFKTLNVWGVTLLFSLYLRMNNSLENFNYSSPLPFRWILMPLSTYLPIDSKWHHYINKWFPSQAKHHQFVSWIHAWACLCSKFSVAPLGVTEILLKLQFAAGILMMTQFANPASF